jgi:hypothetical protein
MVVSEALSEGVLASTLLYICEILRLFANMCVSALFRAKLVHAVTAMLTFRTPSNAEERHMDLEVKHAALMLVQALHSEGEPREVLCCSLLASCLLLIACFMLCCSLLASCLLLIACVMPCTCHAV